MHRPGADPDRMAMSDFLCDFCRREWTEDAPMIEGHRGSIICGRCLTVAYTETILGGRGGAPPGASCTLCLETRADPMWPSPSFPEAMICARCIRQAAGALSKDKESGWKRPEAPL